MKIIREKTMAKLFQICVFPLKVITILWKSLLTHHLEIWLKFWRAWSFCFRTKIQNTWIFGSGQIWTWICYISEGVVIWVIYQQFYIPMEFVGQCTMAQALKEFGIMDFVPLLPFSWIWIVSDRKYLRTIFCQFHFPSDIWLQVDYLRKEKM